MISAADDPARKVAKPSRPASARHAVPDNRLAQINHVAATTGNDPALDTLILRLHTETACRRGGALALRPNGPRRGAMSDPASREGKHNPLPTCVTDAEPPATSYRAAPGAR
jgi:hypothetical protein